METMQFSHHIQANNRVMHNTTIGTYVGVRVNFRVYKKLIPQLI